MSNKNRVVTNHTLLDDQLLSDVGARTPRCGMRSFGELEREPDDFESSRAADAGAAESRFVTLPSHPY